MPVWRYPIVGSTDMTVSPSSSSTSRSTPCVLGCCGPMLTVIVSLRSSGVVVIGFPLPVPVVLPACPTQLALLSFPALLPFDQLADRVDQRAVHFLHARRDVARHVDMD